MDREPGFKEDNKFPSRETLSFPLAGNRGPAYRGYVDVRRQAGREARFSKVWKSPLRRAFLRLRSWFRNSLRADCHGRPGRAATTWIRVSTGARPGTRATPSSVTDTRDSG